jgi:hypothetical protein
MSNLPRLPRIASTCAIFLGTTLGLFAQTNITTWQVNLQHTGANLNETTLTPSLVSAGGFGLLYTSPAMDGQIYGQPLVMGALDFGGTPKTVVYVATERGLIYAIDGANSSASFIWSKSLIPAGATYVPQADVNSGDISDALSITATPVIDPNTNTIYVLAKYKVTANGTYVQRLHALDLKTGDDKPGSPIVVNPTFAGSSNWNGTESSNGIIPFNPLRSHARCALALYNGVVYLAYASHSDTDPYHGEIVGFDAATLQWLPSKTFISTPNGQKAGFWAGGASPAIDSNGNMYVMTGNGPWDQVASPYTTGTNWGMSILKLPTASGAFTVTYANANNWFTPNNWPTINTADADLGSSGILLLPDQAGPHPHLLIGGGKGGQLIILDRDAMGGLATPNNSVQEITEGNSLFVTPAYFNNYIYYAPAGGKLIQRAVGYDGISNYISTNPYKSTFTYNGGHGSHAFITANGNQNGIVWILDLGGPAKIHAYDAANVTGNPIYTGSATTVDGSFAGRKFCVPTAANGKVYFTADNNNSSRLFVFGPPPPAVGSPTAPTALTASAVTSSKIQLAWTDNAGNENGFKVKRALAAGGPYTVLPLNANANQTTYTDSGLNPATTYYYQVVATNANGDSNPTNTASTTTFPLYKPTGLVSYWNFDEGTGGVAFDITGSGRDGALTGELSFDVGYQNTAISFHGTGAAPSRVAIPDSAPLRFGATDSFTLSAWIQQEAVHAGQSEAVIVKSREAGNYYGIYINASNQWAFRGPGGDVTGPAVTTNTWTHVTVVQDGTNAATGRKLYINGTLSASGPTQAADGTGEFWIGQGNGGGSNIESFPGHIDEVRLYNRALSAAEVPTLLAPPVLQAGSRQVHGVVGALTSILSPASAKVVESRQGSTVGTYSLVLNFSAPVSGIAGSLKKQSDGTAATGTVGTITYDSTGTVVTVPLTGVANAQSINLRLTGIQSTGGGAVGTIDIPFNVLWGDVNADNVVDNLDLNIVQGQRGASLNNLTARYDINCDGQIGAADEALVASLKGGTIGTQTVSNIALFRPATATSTINGNIAGKANDGDPISRWESAASDPQTLTINLGTVSSIQSFVVSWEAAAGKTYTIDVSNDGNSWTNAATEANNLVSPVILSYTAPNGTTAKYVRLRGTARTGTFSYSPYEFEIYGIPGTASPDPVPVVTATNASGAVSNNFTYQIAATNTPTSYSATGLPPGLGLNQSSGTITGSPTTVGTYTVGLTAINTNGSGTASITIDIQPAPTAPPQITSPLTASAVIMTPFSYQITANRVPSSYTATNLPQGLTLNPLTGLITGTPIVAGTANIILTATNGIGTTNPGATLVLTTTGGTKTNLALNKNTSTTTAVHTGNIPAFAVDGDQAISRWESEHGIDPADMTIDLGQICTVNSIVLNWQNASGKTYTIDISDNGIGGWTNIVTEPNNPAGGGYVGYSTGTATGRYVRLIGTARTTGYGYSIFEFQVWGTVGGAPTVPPVINSSLTATATMNNAFSYQIAASGSPSSFNATNLPPGLSINTTTGVISGTPTATGTTPITISATNIIGTDTKTLSLTVNLPVPVITSTLTKAGVLNTGLTYQITASNGPTSYNATGLPPGLAINTTTGAITGAPTAAGGTSATISATNSYGTGTATLVFNIAANIDVNLSLTGTATSSSVRGNNVNANAAKAIDNNTGTRWESEWAIDPSWITVDLGQLCTIHKVTLTWEGAGGKNYTLDGSNDGVNFNIPIATVTNNTTTGSGSPLNYTPPGGVVTARYVRMNGTARILAPYGYSIYEFQVWGATGVVPTVSSALTQSGTVGTPLSYGITGTNTPTGYNATNLPPGLTVNTATGVISGTPTAAGTTNTTISAVNGAGSGSATLVFTIASGVSAPVINSTLTQGGTVGTPLTYSITGTNTPASYSATGLPPGLNIDTSTGVISGTPTAAGTTNTTISATNAGGTGNATLVFTIDPAAPVYTPYQQWKLDNGLAIDAPSNTDADSDGLPLLMEYALGLDPAVSSSTGRPVLANASGTLSLTYSKVRSDVTYVVETSTDMVSWTTVGVNQGTPGSNVTGSIPLSSDAKRFLRLRVSVPTP